MASPTELGLKPIPASTAQAAPNPAALGLVPAAPAPTGEPEASWIDQAGGFFTRMVEPYWRGMKDVSAQTYRQGANALMLANKAVGSEDIKAAEDALRAAAQRTAAGPRAETVPGKIAEGIGAAPFGIMKYAVTGGPVGMAAQDALAVADQGLVEAAKAAGRGLLMGKTIQATQPFSRPLRAVTTGGIAATETAASGGDTKDIVSSAATIGGLSALRPGGPVGFRDLLNPKPRAPVPDEINRAVLDKSGEPSPVPPKTGNLNLDRLATTDDVKQTLARVSDAAKSFIGERRGVVSHDQTKALANDLGMKVDDLLSRRRGQAFNAHEALAARTLLTASGENLVGLAAKARAGTDADLLTFQRALSRHVAIQEQVAGMTAEAGRALNQFNIAAASTPKAIKNVLDAAGGRERIETVADMLANLKDPAQVNAVARASFKPTFMDQVKEVYINSLLSGPRTHAVNMLSNTMTALWTLPETATAAAIGKLHGGEKVLAREVPARAFGMIEGGKEGLRAFAKTLRTGEPTDPQTKIETQRHRAVPGVAGEAVRMPGRFLMAEDELFKAIARRSEINALAVRQAAQESLKGPALADRVQQLKANPTPEMVDKAVDYGRYQTFQKQLGEAGTALMRFSNTAPGAKFVLPFIRTPVNLIKYATERTPAGFVMKSVRDDMSGKNGNAARDMAIARMGLGTTIAAVVTSLAAEGHVTGGGPTDRRERALLQADGWQPYSIKIGDTYYAYNRLDPLGLLVGAAADLVEVGKVLPEKEKEKIASTIVAGIVKNLVNKTWLQGPANLVEAIYDPDRYGDSFVNGFLGVAVPQGVAQTAQEIDPVMRDARSTLDTWRARIPGESESLPPKRRLFGEPTERSQGAGGIPFSPIMTTQAKNDPVLAEMRRMKITVDTPDRQVMGVKLPPAIYSEYVRMAGEPAKQLLDRAIASPQWAQLPDGAKATFIRRTISEFREAATRQIMAQHPEILGLRAASKAEEMRTGVRKPAPKLEQ